MSTRTTRLDRRAVTRDILRRQHLAPSSQDGDVVAIASDLVGLHATDPTTPYLSLLARNPQFERHLLDHELYKARTLLRVPAMRNTLFVLPPDLASTAFAALRAIAVRSTTRYFTSIGRLNAGDYEELAPQVVAALAGGERTAAEIKSAISSGRDPAPVIKLLCDEGTLVRTQPVRSWRDPQHAYALMHDWIPEIDLTSAGAADATAHLIRAYLAAYGPASETDIAWWIGLPKRDVRAALSALHDELVSVEMPDAAEMLLLRSDLDRFAEAADQTDLSGIALLPALDPFLQSYRERERYLDPRHAPFVFDRGGNATSAILLDGRVAGVWDASERPSAAIRIHLFVRLGHARTAELREHALRVGTFLFGDTVDLVEFASMSPLSDRHGWVRCPLQGASGPHCL